MTLKKILLLCFISLSFSRKIDKVDDNNLVNFISNDDSVVVLFSKDNCEKCDEYENVLEGIQDELRESLGCGVVKAQNSQLTRIYNPVDKEPALLYFRRGIPLLYDGSISGDEITQAFVDNQEPVVKELSDYTFEHLTQASTGATTGDWFVMFYTSECSSCRRLFAIWEGVGVVLKRRVNVARVNSHQEGIQTSDRFDVSEAPEFIFIRHGKFYRYKGKDWTIKSFVSFIDNLHTSKIKPEPVPPAADTGVQELVKSIKKIFAEMTDYQLYAGAGIAILLMIVACLRSLRGLKKPPGKSTDKKKKK